MTLALPRFQQLIALVDENGYPSQAFHLWWDRFAENLETTFNDLADQVAAIAAAQAAAAAASAAAAAAAADAATAQTTANTGVTNAAAAQTTANTAQSTATSAQTTANTANTLANNVNKNDKNTSSATVPTSILTATDAGSNCTIGVIGHDRQYGDGTSVTLTAVVSAITALAYNTKYAVYYDDTGYSGGVKTYIATTTLKTAQPEKVNGRHYCGQITTPLAGGGVVTSGGAFSPSGSGPYP